MTATLPVLPGEDAGAFQGRIDAWKDELRPRNEAEKYLAERAAWLSWQLDRDERARVARLTASISQAADEARREEVDVAALGGRLFWDRRGAQPLDSTSGYPCSALRTSFSGVADASDSPARLVKRLESSLAGCRWLLDRWAELRARLEPGQSWLSPDKLKAIRLLGKQPLDAADDADVATIFLACHAIDPQCPSAFLELRSDADRFD
jgi:hypothetical protein